MSDSNPTKKSTAAEISALFELLLAAFPIDGVGVCGRRSVRFFFARLVGETVERRIEVGADVGAATGIGVSKERKVGMRDGDHCLTTVGAVSGLGVGTLTGDGDGWGDDKKDDGRAVGVNDAACFDADGERVTRKSTGAEVGTDTGTGMIGWKVGFGVDDSAGASVGRSVGPELGASVGKEIGGDEVGSVGLGVGKGTRRVDGCRVGREVGTRVGA